MPSVEANGTPHGGVALLIKNGTPGSQISLNTSLQAIALRRAITVCSIYLPPTAKYDNAVIDNFITQLPSPVLLLGDFNAHSHLWGYHKTASDSARRLRFSSVADNVRLTNACIINHTWQAN